MKAQTKPGNDSEFDKLACRQKCPLHLPPLPRPPPEWFRKRSIGTSRRMCVRNRWKKPAVIKVCAGSFHRWKYAVRLAWGSVPKPRTWRALAFVSSGGAASITERDLEASDGR